MSTNCTSKRPLLGLRIYKYIKFLGAITENHRTHTISGELKNACKARYAPDRDGGVGRKKKV